jgi:uncharacterized protein (TIGR01777 family)
VKVLISGASGVIGSELTEQLREAGHEVFALVRGEPSNDHEFNWAPSARMLDFSVLDDMDAVVNLSGASLARLPWTRGYKSTILQSRVTATRALAEAMNMAENPPGVFVSASAVGFYGDRPGERLTESSARGAGFLADVVEAWERAADVAPQATRLVKIRTGLVVGRGGVLKPLVPTTKLGVGSRFGTGGQHWPWVSLHDEAAAIVHALTSPTLSGPVNVVGPTPATSDRVTGYFARAMHRPYAFVIPEKVVALGMGEAGRELLLASQRAQPAKLLHDGFRFRHERVEDAIDEWLEAGV